MCVLDRGAAVSLNLVCLGVRHLRVVAAALLDGVDEPGHCPAAEGVLEPRHRESFS